jgi:hypothetical protein
MDASAIGALRAQGLPWRAIASQPGGLGLLHCIVRLYPVPKLGEGILERDKGVAWRVRPLPRPVQLLQAFRVPGPWELANGA